MRKHHYFILTVTLLTVACILPLHGVFAGQIDTTTVATVKEQSLMLQMVNMFVKLASWGWAIVAIIAGKLMSNDFIYAPGLKLDQSLYTLWNYMKNFANFTIGFLFVFHIIKSLFTKDAFTIKKELPKFLIASILANMSWFIMGTLLDIANVATAAVGAFPQVLISDDNALKAKMQELNVGIPDKLCLDMTEGDAKKCVGTYDVKRDIDKIRARFNDMSGPLLFIGASIYRFQDYDLLNKDINDFQSFTTATILKLIMILMYMAPLVALLVVNIKRVFYLWLWIIFAPLIVVFEMLGVKPKGGFIENIFSIKEIIGMIFMPVLVIGGVAIMLVLSIGMYSIMGGKSGAPINQQITSQVLGSAEITSAPGSSTFYNTAAGTEITYVGDVFRDVAGYAGGLIGYLIITTFVIMLLWAVVKMSTSSSKIAGETFKKVIDLGKDLVTSVNMIPMGGSRVSLASLKNGSNMLGENGIIGSKLYGEDGYITEKRKDAEKNLYSGVYNNNGVGKWLQNTYGKSFKYDSDPDNDIGQTDKSAIKNLGVKYGNDNSLDNFIEGLYNTLKKGNKQKKITLMSTEFTDEVFNTLNSDKGAGLKSTIIKELGIKNDAAFTKEALFDGISESSQQFLNFLENNLRGQKTKLSAARKKLPTAKNDFVIFEKNPEKDQTK